MYKLTRQHESGEGGAEEVGDQALGRGVEVLGSEHLLLELRHVALRPDVGRRGGREARRILAEGFDVRDALAVDEPRRDEGAGAGARVTGRQLFRRLDSESRERRR